MDDRTKTFYSFFVLAAALSAAGCGFSQQSRFQMSFLPPAPNRAVAEEDALPPPVVPNRYLPQVPSMLLSDPQAPKGKTRGDATVVVADQAYARGRRLYNQQDFAGARREFDHAIDLMLEASDQNPVDRQEYDAHMDANGGLYSPARFGRFGCVRGGGTRPVRKSAAGRYPADDLPGGSQVEGPGAVSDVGHGFAVAALTKRHGAGVHQLFLQSRPPDDRGRHRSAPAVTGP